MVHVQMGQHNIGHRPKINAGCVQPPDQLTSPREIQIRIQSQPGVNQDGPIAAAYHSNIERPVEGFRWQEHFVQPGRAGGWISVVPEHFGWEW
ncbi:hypothetical protein D3C71_1984490 [compost metagenome]